MVSSCMECSGWEGARGGGGGVGEGVKEEVRRKQTKIVEGWALGLALYLRE